MSAYQIKAVFLTSGNLLHFNASSLLQHNWKEKNNFVFGCHQLRFAMLGIKHQQENNSARAGNMIMLNRFIACNIFSPCLGYYRLTGDTGPEKHNELENAAGAQIGNFTPGFICTPQMDT